MRLHVKSVIEVHIAYDAARTTVDFKIRCASKVARWAYSAKDCACHAVRPRTRTLTIDVLDSLKLRSVVPQIFMTSKVLQIAKQIRVLQSQC